MKRAKKYLALIPVYILVLCAFIGIAVLGNKTVTVLSESAPIQERTAVIIDAGHGGIDGGATSCSGVLESQINLEIALKLNDMMHLLGIETIMIRKTDTSIHTSGNTIAEIKVSDLKERVRIVNNREGAILLSIHQNTFADSRYSGAQVFYAPTGDSKELAEQLQQNLIRSVNQNSNRTIKKAAGIYLMQHIDCTGILVECGFLSNPAEEAQLRNDEYQRKLCCVIASTLSRYLAS